MQFEEKKLKDLLLGKEEVRMLKLSLSHLHKLADGQALRDDSILVEL